MLKHRNEIKEKKYKCMFVNGRIMQLYMVHVILHGTFKCKILLYDMYIHVVSRLNILDAGDSTGIVRISPFNRSTPLDFETSASICILNYSLYFHRQTNQMNELQGIVGYYKFQCIQSVLKICTILNRPLETHFKSFFF